ncbi:MAG: metal ABC transporter permease [bacterium]
MFDFLQYDFMVNAIIASVLASIAFGIVGTYVVVKKIVFIAGGISHTAYGGIGLGYLLGISPIFGAAGFSIAAAIFISIMRRQKSQHEDTLIGMMWAIGMALGVIFINLTPGYVPDLMSYLFGNILTIPSSDLYLMFALDLVIVSVIVLLFDRIQAVTFDEEFSRTMGLPVDAIYFTLLVLIALTTVILIKLVGIILVIALLSIPPAISIKYSKSLKSMMFVSIILGILFTLIGLLFSYYLNLSSGAAIIIVSAAGYGISSVISSIQKKIRAAV